MFWWFIVQDIDQKVDVFLFVDVKDKPKWIALDASWLFAQVLLFYSLNMIVKAYDRTYSLVTKVLYIFAILRLIEYFTFRGQIPMLPMVGAMLIYVIGSLYYKK